MIILWRQMEAVSWDPIKLIPSLLLVAAKTTVSKNKARQKVRLYSFFGAQSQFYLLLCNLDRGLFFTLSPKLKRAFIF